MILQILFGIFQSLSKYLCNDSFILDLDLLWHPALNHNIAQ